MGAREALRLCEENAGKIDLMVTDVIMPEMSGRVLAERVAERCPGLPVLYMSGYTDDAIVRHGLMGHLLEFIQKPFTPEALCGRSAKCSTKINSTWFLVLRTLFFVGV